MTPAMHARTAGVVAEYAFLDEAARAQLRDTWPDLADAVRNLVEQWDAEATETRERLDSDAGSRPRYKFTDVADRLALDIEGSRLRWERG